MKTLKTIGIIMLVLIGISIVGEIAKYLEIFIDTVVTPIFKVVFYAFIGLSAILLFIGAIYWMFDNSEKTSDLKSNIKSDKVGVSQPESKQATINELKPLTPEIVHKETPEEKIKLIQQKLTNSIKWAEKAAMEADF